MVTSANIFANDMRIFPGRYFIIFVIFDKIQGPKSAQGKGLPNWDVGFGVDMESRLCGNDNVLH